VLTPAAAQQRMAALSGEWSTVGTGWQAYPELAAGHALQLRSAGVELPVAEDMLPLAQAALRANQAVAVEQAEPTYLRNTVAWKKLPGRE